MEIAVEKVEVPPKAPDTAEAGENVNVQKAAGKRGGKRRNSGRKKINVLYRSGSAEDAQEYSKEEISLIIPMSQLVAIEKLRCAEMVASGKIPFKQEIIRKMIARALELPEYKEKVASVTDEDMDAFETILLKKQNARQRKILERKERENRT